jgi:hypothetical protein
MVSGTGLLVAQKVSVRVPVKNVLISGHILVEVVQRMGV